MSNSSYDTFSPKTEEWHGDKEIIKKILEELASVKICYDSIVDQNGPFIMFNNEFVIQAYTNIINRGCKIRLITEISANNISYCKILSKLLELRHFDEIKGNLGIVDGLRYGASARSEEKKFPTEYIYSTVKSFVEQQQFFFETLWSKSIPGEQKIKEIEEGIEPIKTQLLQNPHDIFKATLEFYKKSNQIKSCFPVEGLNVIYRDFSNSRKEILDRYRQGKHKGIRWITSLKNKKDIDLVKSHIEDGVKIRHVKELLADSFALSDKSFLFTIENVEEGKKIANVLSSNDKLYLDHYDTIFETLWKKGIDIEERINDIEEGHYVNVDLIPNPKESLIIFQELFYGIKSEVLLMLSSTNAFFRIEHNKDFYACEKLTHRGITVKVLIPLKIDLLEKINQITLKYPKIEFRYIFTHNEPFIGITVLDREKVLLLEIKNDTNKDYIESMGMTIFIESKSASLSYVSIFDSLWKQSEMYEQLKKAFLQLQIHEKMQRDFINVAAHELRTQIQPILGLSKIVKNKINDNEQKDLLDIVIKNANRLKRLTEDILDVTRIEGNKLYLKKESVCLWELLHSIIKELGHILKNDNNNTEFKLYFKNIDLNTTFIADKNRIAQVISNLIVFFKKSVTTESEKDGIGGIISIIVEKTKINSNSNKDNTHKIINEIIISIKDNGKGIDPEIYPRLFTKFASKSFQGTGLGLYISKNIVKAHGGKIWGKNNEDGKGATFGFSLPFIS